MPNQPRADNPTRSFRSEDLTWDPAVAKAERLGLTMTDVINVRLREWTKRPLTNAEKRLEEKQLTRKGPSAGQ